MDINKLIADSQKEQKKQNNCDLAQEQPINPRKKVGRKNRGLTEKNKEEYRKRKNKKLLEEYHRFQDIPQKDCFSHEIIESVHGDVVNNDDISQFKELYQLTCDSILENLKNNNPDLTKKYAHEWSKLLLIELRKNTPKLYADNLPQCIVAWNCISDLMSSIGLYMTYNAFYKVTGIDLKLFKNREKLSPAYSDFLAKIYMDCKNDLEYEFYYSPFTSPMKLRMGSYKFGINEQSEPKQIEVHHDIRNYNNLPMFEKEN